MKVFSLSLLMVVPLLFINLSVGYTNQAESKITDLTEKELTLKIEREINPFWQKGRTGEFKGVNNIPIRYIYFKNAKSKNAVILMSGRGGIYDKYKEVIYELYTSGFSVYAFDHRGQGHSGRMLENIHIGHVDRFQDYIDDTAKFINTVVIKNNHDKINIFAHSMGAVIAAKYIDQNPTVVNKAVFSAPMFEPNTGLFPKAMVEIISSTATLLGLGKHYSIGVGGDPVDPKTLEHDKFIKDGTGSKIRFNAFYRDIIRSNPKLQIGAPSSRWVKEAIRSTNDGLDLSRMGKSSQSILKSAHNIRTPILIFRPTEDDFVMAAGQEKFCKLAKNCKIEVVKGSRHEVWLERESIRKPFMLSMVNYLNEDLNTKSSTVAFTGSEKASSAQIVVGSLVFVCLIVMIYALIRFLKLHRLTLSSSEKATDKLLLLTKINITNVSFLLISFILILLSITLGVNLNGLVIGFIFLFTTSFIFASTIYQNMSIKSKLKSRYQVIKALVSAMELRDNYTKGHSEHVANLLELFYDKLPAGKQKKIDKQLLLSVGLLHDIGKLGIPEAVLHKEGKLNDEEWNLIKKHPILGSHLIAQIDDLNRIAQWIKLHHEKVDGSGYIGLKDTDIPYISRMIAVVDTYSALITSRTYRSRKSHDEALKIMFQVSGKQLDDKLVKIFSKIEQNEIEACIPKRIDYIDVKQIEQIEHYLKESLNPKRERNVINVDKDSIFFDQIISFAEKKKRILTIGQIDIKGSAEGQFIDDYHEADELTEKIGELLIEATRDMDLIFRVNRQRFLLIFPDNPQENAEKLMNRMQDMIKNMEIVQKNSLNPTIERSFINYNPEEAGSLSRIKDFLESCMVQYKQEKS